MACAAALFAKFAPNPGLVSTASAASKSAITCAYTSSIGALEGSNSKAPAEVLIPFKMMGTPPLSCAGTVAPGMYEYTFTRSK